MVRLKVRVHVFQADPSVPLDHRRDARCICGLLRRNSAHQVPAQRADVAEAEARRLGERNDE